MPGSGETWIRPEWLFLIVNRVQAMAASPEVRCVPPTREKVSEVFRPESDLERKLAQSLFEIRDTKGRARVALREPDHDPDDTHAVDLLGLRPM